MNFIKELFTFLRAQIKNFIKSLLIALFILIVIESGFRMLNIDVGLRTWMSDANIIKIYGTENLSEYRKVMQEQNKPWIYKPFVEFTEAPRMGDFVSVSNANIRCNINGDSSCSIKSGKKVIWLFGGSTTFGYGLKNNETIASFLNSMMPDYEVINFGQAGYYSTSERILFNSYLAQGLFPEIAIFLDGLNDYYSHQVPDRSVASNRLGDIFTNNIETLADSNKFITFAKEIARNSDFIVWAYRKLQSQDSDIKQEQSLQSDEVLTKVGIRLEFNFRSRVASGEALGFRVINVLQPIPAYGVGHKTSKVPKEIITLGDHLNSGRGYELLDRSKLGVIGENFRDLSNLEIKEPMYIDTVHYSPELSKRIASELYEMISTNNKP